jgi:hypothetical protein
MIRLHLIGNALLLALGYYWLGVGESTIPRLLWSFLLALVLICATLVLHGAAWTSIHPLNDALRTALRNLAPLFVVALAAVAVYGLLAWWRSASAVPAFNLASWLTLKLRKPVKPASVQMWFNAVLFILRWILVPWVFVPLAAAVASKGWSGFKLDAWKRPRVYWPAVTILLLLALWLPVTLIQWVPKMGGFKMEMTSFIVRAIIAYGLFVGASLALAWVASTSHPRFRGVPAVLAPSHE